MEITVIGDTFLNFVVKENKSLSNKNINPTNFNMTLGGQAANCAYALAELGVKVTFITCIGKDSLNDKILKKLKKVNLKLQKSKENAISFILQNHKKNKYFNSGANANLKFKNKIKTDYVFLGGLWHIPNFDVTKCFKDLNATIFIDPGYNDKPNFKRLHSTLKYADYFLADKEELTLFSKSESFQQALKKVSSTCKLGIHMGSEGSALFEKGKLIKAKSVKYKGNVHNAGDYWNAGFIYATMREFTTKKRLSFANKFAIEMIKKQEEL